MQNRLLALSAAVIVIGSLAGCTVNVGNSPSIPASTSGSDATSGSGAAGSDRHTATAAARDNSSMLAATKTAMTAFGGGTISSAEFDRHGTTWEVRVIDPDGRERTVHTTADGGSVARGVERHDDDADDIAENRRSAAAATVGIQDAIEFVVAAQPGALREIALDDHRGAVVWKATVAAADGEREVAVDAGTGAAVSNERDD